MDLEGCEQENIGKGITVSGVEGEVSKDPKAGKYLVRSENDEISDNVGKETGRQNSGARIAGCKSQY